ncbi:hypothetical protein A2U01_0067502, partial [Trifolium medium]|nr:hypothetical protein [Trifolium medium]
YKEVRKNMETAVGRAARESIGAGRNACLFSWPQHCVLRGAQVQWRGARTRDEAG